MRNLLNQLDASLNAQLYYVSLITALAIPDIAAALDSDDGEARGDRYKAWYEQWVRPRFAESVEQELVARGAPALQMQIEHPLDGDACYRFRCSLLHQGSSQHPKSTFSRIIFVEPGAKLTIRYTVLNDALCIDLVSFCREVIAGATLWLDAVEGTTRFQSNYDRFARRHPAGLKPYIVGVPVVG